MSAAKITKDCVRYAPMLTAREGELEAAELAARDEHLAGCSRCRGEAADFAATEGLVRDALLAEAARRDFAPFVDGVLARVGASVPAGAARAPGRAEPVEARGFLGALTAWVRHHRLVAAAGAIAPAVAGIALIMYVAGDRSAGMQVGDVVVVADAEPVVLQTAEGPVVLLGDADDGGT